MRNLKRALSLTLASVMLLGMMVVGASAAGFPDVEDTHNVEAIEVLKAVDVMVGDDKGNFGPDQQVSRAQMAVVMAKLLNLDYNYYQGQCKFTDVPNWAAPYVAACYANGIVSGYNDTTYGANDDVTAVQAASMMMRALGYFKYKEDYQPTFELATVKQASEIGIFSQVKADAKTPLTRNQVAQMALNALRTEMVTFTGTPGFEANGVTVGYRAEYTQRTGTEAKYNAIEGRTSDVASDANHKGQYYIQLGEQLYDGKLRLNNNATDVFGRPSRYWEFNGKEIGTYAKTELIREEYTTEVTGKTLYEELGSEIIDSIKRGGANDYRLYVAIDGETTRNVLGTAYFTEGSMVRNNNNGVGDTGKGVLTQLFVDGVNKRVDIAIINTYLAQATKNYSSANDDVTLKVYKIDEKPAVGSGSYVKTANQTENFPVDGDDFDIKDVKKDDFFLVTVAQGKIQSMEAPEVLSDVTLNAFKVGSWVRSDGTQYDYASTAQYDAEVLESFDASNMKDVTYNIFLDKYGYMVGLEQNEAVNQYLFLTGLESGQSYLSATDAKANAIFLDGTMKTITVNMKKSMPVVSVSSTATSVEGGDWLNGNGTARKYSQLNTWCAYTVDDDGVYTLKEVGPDSGVGKDGPVKVRKAAQSAMDANPNPIKINTKNVTLDGNTGVDYAKVYGNDETVYINVKTAKITDKTPDKVKIVDDVDSVTTGIKNVDFTVNNVTDEGDYVAPGKEVYTLYKDNGYILAVVTLEAEDNGASASYAYIVGDVKQEEYLGGSKWKWYQDAIVDGKLVTLTETADTRACLNDTKKGLWYELSYNSDGEVASIKSNPQVLANKSIDFTVANDQYINRVSEVDNAVNGTNSYPADKTVLMYVDYANHADAACNANDADMRYENGTLYTNYTTKEGFWVSPNVKVVLCLSKNKTAPSIPNAKGSFDKVYDSETYSGRDGLVDALAALNSDKSAFHGYLSAIIEGKNGATTIILDDRSGVNLGNLEPVKPMTVTINRMGSDGKDLGAVTVLWNGGAAITDATTTTAGTAVNNGLDTLGYEDPTPGNTVASTAFVEDGKMTVTFTYEKGASLETKTGYISVQFQVGGADHGSPITVPVKVDMLGRGTLKAENLEKFIPAGYELDSFTDTPVTDQTGESTPTDTNVAIKLRTDVYSIERANTVVGEMKFGDTVTTAAAGALNTSGVKIKVNFGTDPSNLVSTVIDANAANVTYASAATDGVGATVANNGNVTATYGGKTVDIPVKMYADLASANISGTNNFNNWAVGGTIPAKVYVGTTVTFTLTQDAAAALDETTFGGYTTSATSTAGTFEATGDNAVSIELTREGKGAPDNQTAIVTVTVTVKTISNGTFNITVDAQ